MDRIGVYEWKYIDVDGDITDNLHEDAFLTIRYEIGKNIMCQYFQ